MIEEQTSTWVSPSTKRVMARSSGPVPHLAVGDVDGRIAHEAAHAFGRRLDRLDPVMEKEHLSAPVEFPLAGFGDQVVAPGDDMGDDGHAVPGRGPHERQIANARKGEVQGAGYRGCRQGKGVHRGAKPLEPLLLAHAEPLLLIDDHETQVAKRDVAREEAVGADHDVHRSVQEAGRDLALPARRVEPGKGADHHRILGEPVAEGPGVLRDEHGGGGQHRDLLAVLDSLEGRPDGDLRLAVAGVAADEAVHHTRRLHVPLDVLDGGALVGRVLVYERRLHLALPAGVRGEGVAGTGPPRGVEVQQLGGHLVDRGFGLPPEPPPALPADPVQARRFVVGVGPDPAFHLVEPVDRDPQHFAARVADDERLDRFTPDLDAFQTAEAPDAVFHVDDVVSGTELGEALQRRGAAEAPGAGAVSGRGGRFRDP